MKKSKSALRIAFLSLFMLAGAHAEQLRYDCQNVKANVVIEIQPLSTALETLRRQTKCPISVDADLGGLYTKQRINGRMTPIDALVSLSKGTGLEATQLHQGLGIGRYEQDEIRRRADRLTAAVNNASNNNAIDADTAQAAIKKLNDVVRGAVELAKKQGFISAGELASFDRDLTEVSLQVNRDFP